SYVFPKLEFEFGPVNLFSGGNGSGKTTAADALQALMTAAHDNLYSFNPGQDETTQKGRGGKQVRTLASYLLGCDDGSYARPYATDGYVAAVFHPTEGEVAEPFSAIMAMRGHIDTGGSQKQARLDNLFFMIIPGEQVSLDCFVRDFNDGKHIKPTPEIADFLKHKFPSSSVEVYDKKGAYLRRLYGALRGRTDAVSDREAKHAARTLANFMAYKPVKSIHEFVAGEILEAKDLGDAIRNVSDLMKTIHQMEASASSIKNAISLLTRAADTSRLYIDTWVDLALARYTEASRQVLQTQNNYLALRREKKHAETGLTQATERSDLARERKRQWHQKIVQLEAKRQGINALRDKDELQQQIDKTQKNISQLIQPFLNEISNAQQNAGCAEYLLQAAQQSSLAVELKFLQESGFSKMCRQLSNNVELRNLDAPKVLNNDWLGNTLLEQLMDKSLAWEAEQNNWLGELHISSGDRTRLQLVESLLMDRKQQVERLKNECANLLNEVQLLSSSQVTYPPAVAQALKAIEEACPKAEPRVLCDYVEVLEPEWQMAIEGYLGGARFSILVDANYEAESIAAVRNMRGHKRNSARVIQGEKALRDADKLRPLPQSILDVMAFSHSTAEAYIKASYGNVVRVHSTTELKHTPRGITPEGLGSGNYSLWRCDLPDAELVFGQGARARALIAKEDELNKVQARLQEAQKNTEQLARVVQLMAAAKPCNIAEVLEQLLSFARQINQAEEQLAKIDVGEGSELEQELTVVQNSYLEQEAQEKNFIQDIGRHQAQIAALDKKVTQLLDEQDLAERQRDILEDAVQDIAKVNPRFDLEKALADASANAEKAPEITLAEQLKSDQEQLSRLERELFNLVQAYNIDASSGDALLYDSGTMQMHSFEFFKHLVLLQISIEALHSSYKNNILVAKHKALSSLKDTFNTAFVTNLCHSIYQAINEGESILNDLNAELEHHRFGADRERYSFATQWVPEYKEYWQFFKTVIANPQLGDGTTLFEMELDKKHARIRDELLSMLLDEDEQTAHRELLRISDYRNYRRYEIYKQPENKAPIPLSEYGTGSGGQLETPAYIIRSAAVTSAFRFNEGKAHLRMVMVDEAFSKMDEGRSREVISYLTDALGLQLIFIMPTSKSGPFLDLISSQFVFAKCPTLQPVGELKTRVFVDRKTCNTEQIKNLWAKHRKVIRNQGMLDFMEVFNLKTSVDRQKDV
ncbi:MAG: SbcC/MukB-like Walker B domain-containing protein, partial [Marinagarivorans sp.]|nr:SbcC/MukB-like Walker B domain-containing protein [Marinagarivorans sp.]